MDKIKIEDEEFIIDYGTQQFVIHIEAGEYDPERCSFTSSGPVLIADVNADPNATLQPIKNLPAWASDCIADEIDGDEDYFTEKDQNRFRR